MGLTTDVAAFFPVSATWPTFSLAVSAAPLDCDDAR